MEKNENRLLWELFSVFPWFYLIRVCLAERESYLGRKRLSLSQVGRSAAYSPGKKTESFHEMKGSERKTGGGGAGKADATPGRGTTHSLTTSHPHPSAASSSVVPIPGTFSWPLAARGKPRRGMLRRAVFSDVQRKALEKMFQKQKYISKPDRKKLAAKLGLKDSQVRAVSPHPFPRHALHPSPAYGTMRSAGSSFLQAALDSPLLSPPRLPWTQRLRPWPSGPGTRSWGRRRKESGWG